MKINIEHRGYAQECTSCCSVDIEKKREEITEPVSRKLGVQFEEQITDDKYSFSSRAGAPKALCK